MVSRKCWFNSSKECKCKENKDCIELVFEHAKLVHCADETCVFNLQVPYEFVPNRGIGYKPFNEDIYRGVCTRKDLVLSPIRKFELETNKKITSCRMRADKNLKRPKFPDPDRLEGGLYPDLVDPHAAYH